MVVLSAPPPPLVCEEDAKDRALRDTEIQVWLDRHLSLSSPITAAMLAGPPMKPREKPPEDPETPAEPVEMILATRSRAAIRGPSGAPVPIPGL